jgi:hypothetical protein
VQSILQFRKLLLLLAPSSRSASRALLAKVPLPQFHNWSFNA